ncbi:MAG: shikimate kinase [Bacteroidetes bacterium]|nr:shikimate kinase [Bacteroidota bacterium]
MKQHIFLTGFMGSGKTTLGKATAKLLQLPFVDLDEYIEAKEGKSIQEIFREEGEKSFRELEEIYLGAICERSSTHLIALGGGTICNDRNLQLAQSKGLLIYLELSVKNLIERLKDNMEKRPMLKEVPIETWEHYMGYVLDARKKYYEQSHIKINALHLTAQHLAQTILDFTQKNSN